MKTFEQIADYVKSQPDENILVGPYRVKVGIDIDILDQDIGLLGWLSESTNFNDDEPQVTRHFAGGDTEAMHRVNVERIMSALENGVDPKTQDYERIVMSKEEEKPDVNGTTVKRYNNDPAMVEQLIALEGQVKALEETNTELNANCMEYMGMIKVYERLLGEGIKRER